MLRPVTQGENVSRQPGELRGSMRLSEFVAEWFLPVFWASRRRRPKPSSIAELNTAVRRWREITSDPPLRHITNDVCSRFVEQERNYAGRAGQPLSEATIRKHAAALQQVLDLAGPRSPENRRAARQAGLFGRDRRGWPRPAPCFPELDVPQPIPEDLFSLDELRAWIAACRQHATDPWLPICRPGSWWEALIRTLYNADLRIATALAMRREWIHEAQGAAWLEVPGESYKGGQARMIYLSPAALAAIRSIPTIGRVFPWPFTPQALQHHRRRLQKLAGIPERGFHALRRTGLSALWIEDPKAAQVQAGHASAATTLTHYCSREARGLALAQQVQAAAGRIAQP